MTERFVVFSVTGYAGVGDRDEVTVWFVGDRLYCHAVLSRHFTRAAAKRRAAHLERRAVWRVTRACPLCGTKFVPLNPDHRFCRRRCRSTFDNAARTRPHLQDWPDETLRAWHREKLERSANGRYLPKATS